MEVLSKSLQSRESQLLLTASAIGLGGYFLYNQFFSQKLPYDKKDFEGKVVIVTGANTGIGYYAAERLAGFGATVILACRDEKKAKEAVQKIKDHTKNPNVRFELLDVSSLLSIEKFIKRIEKCHILINNAGAMFPDLKRLYRDRIESTFMTNYVGPWYLTRLLIPILAKTSLKDNCEVKIVNVASRSEGFADYGKAFMAASYPAQLVSKAFQGPISNNNTKAIPYSMWQAYGNSKLGNLLFTFELANRLGANKNIKNETKEDDKDAVNKVIHYKVNNTYELPAHDIHLAELTALQQQADKRQEKTPQIVVVAVTPGITNTEIVRYLNPWIVQITSPLRYLCLKSAAQGAEEVVFAASLSSPHTGKYFGEQQAIVSSAHAQNSDLARLLWEHTGKIIEDILMDDFLDCH